MGKFEFAGFDCGGMVEMFVANAKKYTPAQTVALCLREYAHRFVEGECHFCNPLRIPTVEDVQDCHSAYRLGLIPDYPDGGYTLVRKDEPGAFPVWVIDFERLKREVQS